MHRRELVGCFRKSRNRGTLVGTSIHMPRLSAFTDRVLFMPAPAATRQPAEPQSPSPVRPWNVSKTCYMYMYMYALGYIVFVGRTCTGTVVVVPLYKKPRVRP